MMVKGERPLPRHSAGGIGVEGAEDVINQLSGGERSGLGVERNG